MSGSRMRCYYEVLDLERDCAADEIKKQYRRLALQWHPDKNVGNEVEATTRFKEITTAHAVLINPQERKWYDDHRENILSGGDGTAKSGEGAEDPEENLWPYFNANCFKGFHDGSDGFYGVYRGIFNRLHEEECAAGSSKDPSHNFSFGSKEYVDKEVLDFYSHWSNFVTGMGFGHADIYDVREAPNRIVKRAIEKENKKARDEAKRKYQDQVKALVAFVRGIDPRIIKIETERRKKKAEEDALKAEKRAAELLAKKELRARRQMQLENDEEELARRKGERSRAYLLADNDDEYDELHRAAAAVDDLELHYSGDEGAEEGGEAKPPKVAPVPRGRRMCYAFVKGECARGDKCEFAHDASDVILEAPVEDVEEEIAMEEAVEEEDGEYVIMRCELCRKDFKSEAQMEQHFTSRSHRKKDSEKESKKGKKGGKQAVGPAAKVATESAAIGPEGDDDLDEVVATMAAAGISKKALKKKNKRKQALGMQVEDGAGSGSDEEDKEEELAVKAMSAAAAMSAAVGYDSSSSSSDED